MQLLAVSASALLFAAGATLARAAAEPPTTTTDATTTTSTVAPGGSYGWELVRPRPPQRRKPAAPAATPVVTTTTPPSPTVATAPVAKPHRTHRAKPPRVRRHRAARTVDVVKPQRTGAVLAARRTAERETYASILIVAALGLAIACFTVGATPAAHVRWRTAAIFVAYRSAHATIAGAVSLLVALALLALTSSR